GCTLHDAAENVHQHGLDVFVVQDNPECFADLFRVGPTADVQKVSGLSAMVFDNVHGAHRQPRSVDQAGDIAIQFNVAQSGIPSSHFGRLFFVQITKFANIGVTEHRVFVKG